MITCRFETENGRFKAMTLSGHAGYATEGEDVVCAAVSAACDLTMHLAEEYFGTAPEITVGKKVSFRATGQWDVAHKLLCGFRDYLKMVQAQHPTCINIEYTEV